MADSLSSVTGLSSGMDWRSLVDQVMTLERRPAARLEALVATNAKRRDALAQFEQALTALGDAAAGLRDGRAFDARSVTAVGNDANGRALVAATATAGAAAGRYTVRVTALAQAQKVTAGAGYAPDAAAGAAGTLRITRTGAGSPTVPDITLAAGDTLATVRDKINARNTGATPSGVQASLVSVSATEQRLVLTAAGSGTDGAFTLSQVGGTGLLNRLGLDPAASPTTRRPVTQAAANAAFTVDGVAMTRATNTVADAIPGVTLTLSATDATRTSTVAVERDAAAAPDALKAFADAYNRVQQFVRTQSADRAAPLYNDPLVRSVRSGFGQLVAAAAAPAGTPGGSAGVAADLTTLSSLGLALQKDGTLQFTAATFTDRAAGRPADVRALLAARMGAVAGQVDTMAKPVLGLIDQRESGLELQNARYTARVADIDARLEKRRAAMVAQYAKFEGSLGRLKQIGEQMTAQFTRLNNSDD